jgi:hypothetical protein
VVWRVLSLVLLEVSEVPEVPEDLHMVVGWSRLQTLSFLLPLHRQQET